MRRTTPWLAAAILALAAASAEADWIVTKDGGKFEIQGSYAQKGKMIVFTSMSGTLSSLRADRVDFDASKAATEAAKQKDSVDVAEVDATAKAEDAKVKKKSTWVLTDKDFKKTSSDNAPGAADTAIAAKDYTKDVVPGSSPDLRLVKWDRVTPADPATAKGVEVAGQIQNTSTNLLSDLTVTVSFFDDSGNAVGRFPADMTVSQLHGQEVGDFKATAVGVYTFGSVKFDLRGSGFKQRGPADAAKPADSAAPPPPPPPPGF
jgi:hypothetical protein